MEADRVLPTGEREKAMRLDKVLAHAFRVFGSKEKALRWLSRPHPEFSLDHSRLALCATEEGSILVTNWLNAIDNGFSA